MANMVQACSFFPWAQVLITDNRPGAIVDGSTDPLQAIFLPVPSGFFIWWSFSEEQLSSEPGNSWRILKICTWIRGQIMALDIENVTSLLVSGLHLVPFLRKNTDRVERLLETEMESKRRWV